MIGEVEEGAAGVGAWYGLWKPTGCSKFTSGWFQSQRGEIL